MGIRGEERRPLGIYVHIPFCVSKCPYCDFASTDEPRIPEERYTACITRELETLIEKGRAAKNTPLETVYFGGGTPSIFSPSSIAKIIEKIKSSFAPEKDIEVTLEANPDTIDKEKLPGFKAAGVNRLSIGFQSLDDGILKTLGRTHSAQKALDSFNRAREAGLDNIGVDLIFAVPGQDLETWRATLMKATGLRPEHISLYGLTIEEGTPFHNIYRDGRYPEGGPPLPSEEEYIAMYKEAVSLLSLKGYVHYEISNFALPGKASRHNSRYWSGADYIGLGVSAHSYLSRPGWGRRWWNETSPLKYMDSVESAGEAAAAGEELGRVEAMTEALMLGLRVLGSGVSGEAFKSRFGIYPREAVKGFDDLLKEGLIDTRGEDITLTPKGVLVSNEIMLRISG